jgi:hypothetical protein
MGKNQGDTRVGGSGGADGVTIAPKDGGKAARAKTDASEARAAKVRGEPRAAAAPSLEKKSKEPKLYRALARGYIDGMIREPGDIFATADTPGTWMEPVGKGKESRVAEAVSDTMSTKKDDPNLENFSRGALEAEYLRLGGTDPKGLSDDDLITAIRAAYVSEAQ